MDSGWTFSTIQGTPRVPVICGALFVTHFLDPNPDSSTVAVVVVLVRDRAAWPQPLTLGVAAQSVSAPRLPSPRAQFLLGGGMVGLEGTTAKWSQYQVKIEYTSLLPKSQVAKLTLLMGPILFLCFSFCSPHIILYASWEEETYALDF